MERKTATIEQAKSLVLKPWTAVDQLINSFSVTEGNLEGEPQMSFLCVLDPTEIKSYDHLMSRQEHVPVT